MDKTSEKRMAESSGATGSPNNGTSTANTEENNVNAVPTGDSEKNDVKIACQKEKPVIADAAAKKHFSSELLGIEFSYPESWGDVKLEEIIRENYLFPGMPPAALGQEFERRGLPKDFIETFTAWEYDAQMEFLKKDRGGYDAFLSKEANLSFSKNQRAFLSAFNENYLDMSGYENAVPVSTVYKGDAKLESSAFDSASPWNLPAQLKIDRLSVGECSILANGLLKVAGDFDASGMDEKITKVVIIGNLSSSLEYDGMVLQYLPQNHGSPSQTLNEFMAFGAGVKIK
ncbi:MAG: hypothetical protein MUD10_02760 [Candidatus Pacebacteria bacterium]|nr:hypothetical protein [Candidatus Paceibacterota bacterium]